MSENKATPEKAAQQLLDVCLLILEEVENNPESDSRLSMPLLRKLYEAIEAAGGEYPWQHQ